MLHAGQTGPWREFGRADGIRSGSLGAVSVTLAGTFLGSADGLLRYSEGRWEPGTPRRRSRRGSGDDRHIPGRRHRDLRARGVGDRRDRRVALGRRRLDAPRRRPRARWRVGSLHLTLASDGSLWVATETAVVRLLDGRWAVAEEVGAQIIEARTGTAWATGIPFTASTQASPARHPGFRRCGTSSRTGLASPGPAGRLPAEPCRDGNCRRLHRLPRRHRVFERDAGPCPRRRPVVRDGGPADCRWTTGSHRGRARSTWRRRGRGDWRRCPKLPAATRGTVTAPRGRRGGLRHHRASGAVDGFEPAAVPWTGVGRVSAVPGRVQARHRGGRRHPAGTASWLGSTSPGRSPWPRTVSVFLLGFGGVLPLDPGRGGSHASVVHRQCGRGVVDSPVEPSGQGAIPDRWWFPRMRDEPTSGATA